MLFLCEQALIEYLQDTALMEVRLTGGEPTLHNDFIESSERFREGGIYVSVATNGVWRSDVFDYF